MDFDKPDKPSTIGCLIGNVRKGEGVEDASRLP